MYVDPRFWISDQSAVIKQCRVGRRGGGVREVYDMLGGAVCQNGMPLPISAGYSRRWYKFACLKYGWAHLQLLLVLSRHVDLRENFGHRPGGRSRRPSSTTTSWSWRTRGPRRCSSASRALSPSSTRTWRRRRGGSWTPGALHGRALAVGIGGWGLTSCTQRTVLPTKESDEVPNVSEDVTNTPRWVVVGHGRDDDDHTPPPRLSVSSAASRAFCRWLASTEGHDDDEVHALLNSLVDRCGDEARRFMEAILGGRLPRRLEGSS